MMLIRAFKLYQCHWKFEYSLDMARAYKLVEYNVIMNNETVNLLTPWFCSSQATSQLSGTQVVPNKA